MTSVSRLVAAALLGLAGSALRAAPLPVALPCERPVLVAGGEAMQADGLPAGVDHSYVSRMQLLFGKVCHGTVQLRAAVEPGGRLSVAMPELLRTIRTLEPAVVMLDYPHADVAAGAGVDAMMGHYEAVLKACDAVRAVCIVGGQRPVESAPAATEERQLELERRASAAFGTRFLPTYAYFRSEVRGRHAMLGLFASPDSPRLNEQGHELLFNLHRRRLLEATAHRD